MSETKPTLDVRYAVRCDIGAVRCATRTPRGCHHRPQASGAASRSSAGIHRA
jgi:hypothetical protein